MLVRRFNENPLIKPSDVKPSRPDYEVIGSFNAGTTVYQDEILLLLRVAERPLDMPQDAVLSPIYNPQTREINNFIVPRSAQSLEIPDSRVFRFRNDIYLTSISHLRLARSRDGIHFSIDSTPAVFPKTEYETYGLEDPRITRIGNDFWITYKPVSKHGICTGLLHTRDFKTFERKGIIFCPENIDVVIFPEFINGNYYALTRPVVHNIGPLAIWIAESTDLLHWGNHQAVILPRPGTFDGGRVGASTVPFRTEKGWLEIYHGADEKNRYCLAAALFDLQNPARLLARSETPFMHPSAPYEIQGFFGNVVFSCGCIVDDNENITIYYGAADTYTAAATISMGEIFDHLALVS